jgi:hypothetical protein
MDAIPDAIISQQTCSENRNELIQKLLLFCSASPLTGESKTECVRKRVAYLDDICNIKEDHLINQIEQLSKKYPDKNIKTLCHEVYDKNSNVFTKYLKSSNKIIRNDKDIVTLSQNWKFVTSKYKNGKRKRFFWNRASFCKYDDIFWYAYNDKDTPTVWNDDVDLGDGDKFHEIYVDIDDDYNMSVRFQETDYEVTSIKLITATSIEMYSMINNLENMGLEVRKKPDPNLDAIRSELFELKKSLNES